MRHHGSLFPGIVLLAASALPVGVALADDASGQFGVYAGGSVGPSSERFRPDAYSLRAQNTGYQAALGFRPIDLFAAELDYVNFGRAYGGVNYADTDGVGVSALGFLPIPLVDVYGRVGVTTLRTDVSSPYQSFHRSGADLSYGVGAGMHWGSLGARVEYQRFDLSIASTMSLTSVGITWTFL
jgi:OmpA-like transmembrane domain